ncbi:MAG: IS1380 family transposase [Actinomycetes bacterium]
MRVSHTGASLSVAFDDPNLVACAGLVPAMTLAARCGLNDLVADRVRLKVAGGANASVKVSSLVAGMVAGADSIDAMDLLRHGGMGRLFGGVRAPSTLGTFLRGFTFGHVRQLDSVAAAFLVNLAAHTPVLSGGERVAFVDIDDTIKPTFGYAKQGAGHGYNKVKGINALIVTVSTPSAAPVIAATRLRRGPANSARGAHHLLAEALGTAKRAGATGLITVRADSAYFNHTMVATARRGGACFSITARLNSSVTKAISTIDDTSWTPIRYPNAIWDAQENRWVSDAEVAEIEFTAFTSLPKKHHVSARLIVRRVKRLTTTSTTAGQSELFPTYRYHSVFTDSPLPMLDAEKSHRAHAVVEQIMADLKDSALGSLPSGDFSANGAWLVCAAMAFNLTRAAGALASLFHAKARTGTIRNQLINVPARLACSARKLVVHLPRDWPWETAWQQLFTKANESPPAIV